MKLVFSLILVCMGIQLALGCSCAPELLQDRVCETNPNTILFKGIVESVSTTGNPFYGQNIFVLKKVKVFQDISNLAQTLYLSSSTTNNKRLEVGSAIQSATCGVNMAVGTKWLIDGSYSSNDGRFNTNSCSKTQSWPTDPPLKNQLWKLLKWPDCSCTVRNCNYSWTASPTCETDPHTDDECIMTPYTNDPTCSVTYRRCKRCAGVCSWHGRSNNCAPPQWPL